MVTRARAYNKGFSKQLFHNSEKRRCEMEWHKRLYLGTWQFGGQFKNLSDSRVKSLLGFALMAGICRFDTASVYGSGRVEEILGSCLPESAIIVTKIPAVKKPALAAPVPIYECYPLDHIERSVASSLNRLKKTRIDTVLLHNWLPSWSSDALDVFHRLRSMKDVGIIQRVGISLPDDFASHIDDEVLPFIDVIEAPFNSNQRWMLAQLPNLLGLKKEVLLRSLFCQGKVLKEGCTPKEVLREALLLNTSVVIGMTTEEQILSNIKLMKGE